MDKMAKVLMKSGRFHPFQLPSLLILVVSVCSENVFDADFSLIPRLGGAVRTTMSTAYGRFNSSLAIDGKAGNPDACFCCSIANGQTQIAWLEIDLGQQYYITGIKIYGRNDEANLGQSTDIDVFIGNRSLSYQTLSDPLISIQHGTSMDPYTKQSTTPWRFQVFLIRKQSADYLTICEVQFREDANIINPVRHTMQTQMSTTYVETSKSFTADLAVDGNANTNAGTCSCCSATDGSSSPWWQLDLGRKFLISRMELIGTTEVEIQSKNVDVYISNDTLLQGNSPITSNESIFSAVDNFSGSLFNTNKTAIFQYLMIRRWYQSVLTICELKLYSQECDLGRYGVGCIHSCHCSNNAQCDAVTGHCPSGCAPGYTGATCDTVCAVGNYGQNCTNSCGYCIQKSHCDPVDGNCTGGCEAGFQGAQCNIVCTPGSYGQNCGLHCHCANGTACDTRNGSCPVGCDIGWSGPSCQKDNSLLSKLTNATTEASNIWGGFNAGLALDGLDDNLYTSFNACKCCSVVDGNNPWWQVDLGAKYLVGAVYIVGRHSEPIDQSKNINIIGSNDTATVNDATNTLFNVTISALGTRFLHNFTDHPKMLRYLRIQKRTNTVLTICEVRLIEGICRLSWFGDKCRHRCHCVDQKACNPIHGTCQSAYCSPGWSGSACDTACKVGRFGQNCSGVSHCINGTANNNVNGTCIKGLCDPGWRGDACDKECENGKFGPNCSGVAHCINGTANNIVNGSCQAGICDPGWMGYACDTKCGDGRFGHNCSGVAHCINGTANNNVNGSCQAGICDPGWMGYACDTTCGGGRFGQNCSGVAYCFNGTANNNVNGSCQAGNCDPGWRGYACDTECEKGRFGQNCSGVAHCINGTANNHVNGTCIKGLCDPGWREYACDKECENGKFGPNCSGVAHCINGTTNNIVNGSCQADICDPGWMGYACDTKCGDGRFGQNCSGVAHCINGTANNNVNGSCQAGNCDPGWRGYACDTVCESGRFGQNCSGVAHCINGAANNNVDGRCKTGECDPGWKGHACDTECEKGTFGHNCYGVAHCINNTANNNVNGSCIKGVCDPGWRGYACDLVLSQTAGGGKFSSTLPAVGGVLGAAAIVAIIVVVVFIKRRQQSKQSSDTDARFDVSNLQPVGPKPSSTRLKETNVDGFDNKAIEEDEHAYYSFSPTKSAIKSSQLWHYIRKMQADKSKAFFDEFETLPDGLKLPCKEALRPENRSKNRYRDKYAYDHSRVVLKITGPGQTDYINASHIHGFERSQEFIASQGPTEKMLDDFWRMVWQQQATTIVMLTNCMENGNKKCEKYWPDDDEVGAYGAVRVKVIATDMYADYYRREMEVTMADSPSRIVTQFHFKSWPDKDVPDSTWCLVNFWRAASRHPAPSDKAPIIVHCSAGIGRTGTYIALDYLYNQLQHEGSVQPLKAVQALRQQRVNMVQTRHQYAYLHEAVADAIGLGTHFIWASQFEDYFNYLTMVQPGSSKSPLEIQFDLAVRSIQDLQAEKAVGTGEDDVGLYANASIAEEIDAYRPATKKRGSKYVQEMGAMYLPAYTGAGVFLVANSPTEKSLVEFWSLVREENIKTVISLCESTAKNYKAASQLGVDSGLLKGTFDIKALNLNRCSSYNDRTYMFLENGQTEEESRVTVRVFDYTAWKAGYNTPVEAGSLLELLEAITSWQPHVSESQPILIHCNTGTRRSGVVCLLLSELQRIKREDGQVNLLDSLMVLMERCHGVIENAGQYQFCHDVIRRHLDQQQRHQQQDPGDQNIYANL